MSRVGAKTWQSSWQDNDTVTILIRVVKSIDETKFRVTCPRCLVK